MIGSFLFKKPVQGSEPVIVDEPAASDVPDPAGTGPRLPEIPSANYRNNTIFIHVPKAAGSTISLSLFGYRVSHRSIDSFWSADPGFTERCFKFSFVRHPYFRFASAYRFLSAGGMSSRDAALVQRYRKEFSSMRALAEACEVNDFLHQIVHLQPQWTFLSLPQSPAYRIYMDYVGKTEFLDEGIDVLQTMLSDGLAKRLLLAGNTRRNAGPPASGKVDREVFQAVRRIYEDDFELFGYDEWGTVAKAQTLLEQLEG